MSLLVSFLIAVLIIIIVVYVVKLLLDMLTLPQQVKIIALLIVGLIALIYLFNHFGRAIGL